MSFRNFQVPYPINEKYSKKAAYFSMEFAIHQPLKIYSGGLGFLAGSHLRSAFELNQNMIGIGMLWKYGYYDQARNQDQTLQVSFAIIATTVVLIAVFVPLIFVQGIVGKLFTELALTLSNIKSS